MRLFRPLLMGLLVGFTVVGGRLPASAQDGAGRPAPPDPPVVVDSTGQPVGRVLRTIQAFAPHAGSLPGLIAEVSVRVGGRTVALWVNRDRFLGYPQIPPDPALYVAFDGSDCTGTPFVTSPVVDQPLYAPTLLPFVAIGPDQKLYVGEGEPVFVAATFAYIEIPPGACVGFGPQVALPATLLGDLSVLFPPPYRIQ